MAISKDKKKTLVADLTELLSSSKMTVFAKYQGLTVAELQELRKNARENGVKIKVVKNRLVRVAMGEIAVYKDTDTTGLEGQLLYAVSDSDEVAPAKVVDCCECNSRNLAVKSSHVCRALNADDEDGEPSCHLIHLLASALTFHLELPERRDENTKKLDHDGCRDVWHHTQRKDRSVSESSTREHVEETYEA